MANWDSAARATADPRRQRRSGRRGASQVRRVRAPPRQWTPGASAGSTFSSNWFANSFMTYGSGYDKTVTFIRNTNYGWVNTKRGTADYLETYAPFDGTYKAHCVAHTYFWGSCNVR